MRPILRVLSTLVAVASFAAAQDGPGLPAGIRFSPTRSADGFDMPVGKPDAEGYYRSRGLIIGRHMGDDWNGNGMGNTDLGAPVYSTAHGLVVYARDARMGWGKTVIVRHVYWEGGRWNYVDSFYTHMHQIFVREGQQVRRGQLVGSIGTNRGMYVAHLHFEIRKNLRIGINQGSYRKDLSNYYRPYEFILGRRTLQGGNRRVSVPLNTFRLQARVVDEMGGARSGSSESTAPSRPGGFKVNRYGEPLR
ncbi:MAG: M23 family metallopeptidase [Chthoniobacterales bacterium]|nr:M23 family metallopeptidase [Chthoniobacterales bacterium]